jgi:hypothetical protein
VSRPDLPSDPASDPLPEAVRRALEVADASVAERADDLAARHVRALAAHWALIPPGTAPDAALALGPESFLLHLEVAGKLNAAGDAAAAAAAVKLAARLDYQLSPHKRHGLTGPFNGQFVRQKIFLTLNARLDLQAVFETGSYRGETTEFLAQQVACPVRTCELMPFTYELCRLRLDELAASGTQRAREVTLDFMDSRAFLVQRLPALVPDAPVFIYLDAHGYDAELPLEAECAIILAHPTPAVILIDDMDVPDDPGFRPPGTLPGDVVSLDHLADVYHRFDAAFFPASSAAETGLRKGSVLLTTAPALTALLDGLPDLRRVPAALAP